MAQKAMVWLQDPPAINGSSFRFTVQVTYLDNVAPATHHDGQGLVVDVALNLLSSARAEVRDAVIAQADTVHGWTLGNDDVLFPDFSMQLI